MDKKKSKKNFHKSPKQIFVIKKLKFKESITVPRLRNYTFMDESKTDNKMWSMK